jgi:hypothetical protein
LAAAFAPGPTLRGPADVVAAGVVELIFGELLRWSAAWLCVTGEVIELSADRVDEADIVPIVLTLTVLDSLVSTSPVLAEFELTVIVLTVPVPVSLVPVSLVPVSLVLKSLVLILLMITSLVLISLVLQSSVLTLLVLTSVVPILVVLLKEANWVGGNMVEVELTICDVTVLAVATVTSCFGAELIDIGWELVYEVSELSVDAVMVVFDKGSGDDTLWALEGGSDAELLSDVSDTGVASLDVLTAELVFVQLLEEAAVAYRLSEVRAVADVLVGKVALPDTV